MFPVITSDFYSFHMSTLEVPKLDFTEERELLVDAKEGCKKALQRIISSHLRIVTSQVLELKRNWDDCHDMFQEGCIALLESINSFDLSFQNRFCNHCKIRVRSSIMEWISNNRQIKLWTTHAVKKLVNNRKKYDYLSEEGRRLAVNELNVEESDIDLYLERSSVVYDTTSVDSDGTVNCVYDNIESCNTPDPEHLVLKSSDIKIMRTLLDKINQRHRYIIESTYFQGRQKVDIAAEMGVSVQRVAQMEKEGILALRKHLMTA